MPATDFQSTFNQWLDASLAHPIPANVVAFSFNLAEPWCIEVVGSDVCSEKDSDWACADSFRPKHPELDLPESEVGSDWESALEAAKELVLAYLDRPSVGASILKKAEAVAIGFLDGELHRISK
jgi:shikimate kinase